MNGPVVQSQDYYPFGLSFNSYNRENSLINKYLYNGKEKQDALDLGWFDYGARMYSPEVGRWMVIDPSGDKEGQEIESPYGYVGNNPIKRTDPDGKIWSNIVGAVVGAAVEYGSQVAANVYENGFSGEAFTKNIDVGDIAIAAGEGFLTSGTSAIKNVVAKTAVKVGAEVLRNAVDVKDGEVSTNSVKSTVVNTVIGLAAGKTGDKVPTPKGGNVINAKTANQAVREARDGGKVLTTKERVAIQNKANEKVAVAKSINESVKKAPASTAAGATGEELKRTSDKNLKD